MNRICTYVLALLFAHSASASEQSMLARVTVYWHSRGSKQCVSAAGAHLRNGHCAVDPRKIPYGSEVSFPDATCVAVDTGPAVVRRTAARRTGRTPAERDALVVDRYFESKGQAVAWEALHPHFMKVRVVSPAPARTPVAQVETNDELTADNPERTAPTFLSTSGPFACVGIISGLRDL